MYTYLDKNLNEKTLAEGVRITDGPRKTWYDQAWPLNTVFVCVQKNTGELSYHTKTEAAVKLGLSMRQVNDILDGKTKLKDYRIFQVPRKIFVEATGKRYTKSWKYFWEY
jgi:hypothetical protein